MAILPKLLYIVQYPFIPFWRWGQWRRRKKYFDNRQPIELDRWALVYGEQRGWDKKLCRLVLDSLELFTVDARRLRPTDRFDQELRIPARHLQEDALRDVFSAITLVVKNRRVFAAWPTPPSDLESGSIEQLLDYFNGIWTSCPKSIDRVSGTKLEPETDA